MDIITKFYRSAKLLEWNRYIRMYYKILCYTKWYRFYNVVK